VFVLSKNNQQEIIRKMEDQRQRFSLRKYGVGVASVLIGLTFMGGYTVTAHADTQTAPVVAVQDSQNQIGGGVPTALLINQ